MPRLVTYNDVDTGIFTSNQASGGTKGHRASFIKLDKGAVMTKIQAWKESWRIRGVKMWMSDGTSKLFGFSRGLTSSSFEIGFGETITKLNIQSSGEHSSGGYYRLGAIYIHTNLGREWGIYSDNLSSGDMFWPEVGSGIVCGMFGACGDDVDNLGFALLQPIQKARLVDVTYPILDAKVPAKTPTTVASNTFINKTTLNQSITLSGSHKVTTVREWSNTTGLEFSIKTSVTAGIPEVVSTSTSASWGVSNKISFGRSTTKTEDQSWTWPIICPAQTKIYASGTMYADNIDTKYAAKMQIELKNGKVYEYNVEGIYKGMNVRNGILTVETLGSA